MASRMRSLPGTLRFRVVQESHTSGLMPAARLWVAGEARANTQQVLVRFLPRTTNAAAR